MFCKHCGIESKDNQKFCTNCGVSFSNTSNNHSYLKLSSITDLLSKNFEISKVIPVVVLILFIGWGIYSSLDSSAIDTNNEAQESYDAGGDPNQAISQLQQASQDAVGNSTKLLTKVNLAYVYSSEGKNDLALDTFKEALVFASEGSLDYYLISGEVALLEGKPNAALISYNKAYEKDSTDFQVNNALNLFYLDLEEERPQYENYPKALTYAIKAYETNHSNTVKQNLAIAHYFNNNYKQAISLLSSVSNISSEPYLAYWLGLAYVGDQQPVNAKRYLQIAINGGVDVPQEIIDYMRNN